jgi:hypothetical protein
MNRESVEKVRNQYIRMLERFLTSQDLGIREGPIISINSKKKDYN